MRLQCPAELVRALLPDARVTMMADTFDAAQLRQCFTAGADGYLLKDMSAESLRASLALVLLGEKLLPSSLAELLSRNSNGSDPAALSAIPIHDRAVTGTLSDRELDIMRCLVDGDSNKRIANRLQIAEATVKVHLKSILRKTRAANRTQAAIWAFQRGVAGMAAAALIAVSSQGLAGISIAQIASGAM